MVGRRPLEAERMPNPPPRAVLHGEWEKNTQEDYGALGPEQIPFWERRRLSEKSLKVQEILLVTDQIAEDTVEHLER